MFPHGPWPEKEFRFQVKQDEGSWQRFQTRCYIGKMRRRMKTLEPNLHKLRGLRVEQKKAKEIAKIENAKEMAKMENAMENICVGDDSESTKVLVQT